MPERRNSVPPTRPQIMQVPDTDLSDNRAASAPVNYNHESMDDDHDGLEYFDEPDTGDFFAQPDTSQGIMAGDGISPATCAYLRPCLSRHTAHTVHPTVNTGSLDVGASASARRAGPAKPSPKGVAAASSMPNIATPSIISQATTGRDTYIAGLKLSEPPVGRVSIEHLRAVRGDIHSIASASAEFSGLITVLKNDLTTGISNLRLTPFLLISSRSRHVAHSI